MCIAKHVFKHESNVQTLHVRKLFDHEELSKKAYCDYRYNKFVHIRSFSCIKFVDLQGLICFLGEPNDITDLFKGTVSVDHIKGAIFKSMIFM